MKKDADDIYLLMTAKVAGVITAEEAAWLDQQIQENPDIKARWEAFLQQHSPDQVQDAFRLYDQDWVDAADITAIPPQELLPAYKKKYRVAAISLALAGICLGIYLFNARNSPTTPPLLHKQLQIILNRLPCRWPAAKPYHSPQPPVT